MRVVWDPLGLDSRASGIGVVGHALLGELAKLGVDVSVGRPVGRPWSWVPKVASPVSTLLRNADADVFHGFANINLPVLARARRRPKFVLTIHDLIPLMPHSGVSLASQLQMRALLPLAVDRADAIVCVSQLTQQLLVERFPVAERRTLVIPNAYGRGRRAPAKVEDTAQAPNRSWRVLMVARYERYKRIGLFLEVLRELGMEGWVGTLVTDRQGSVLAHREASELIARGVLTVSVQVSAADLGALLEQSDCYLHTSLCEGFGMPIAEAIARGVPSVAGEDVGVGPYLIGSGLLRLVGACDPVSEWCAAVKMICAAREEQIAQGFPRWTWKDAALRYKEVYTRLVT